MHAGEVVADAAVVRRLLDAQFPHWADLTIEPVASAGTDNTLFRLGDGLSARLPRIPSAATQLDKECAWVPRLEPLVPAAIPVPVAKGAPGQGYPWPWSVCRWVEGQHPTVEALGDSVALATHLAKFVGALRAVDPDGGPPAGPHNFHRGVALTRRDEPTQRAIASLQGTIDSHAVSAAWDEALAAPAWTNAGVWVHGDIAAGNLLVRDGSLTGVIDFGGLGLGDPAVDLLVAWNLLRGAARDVYRAEAGIDDATWARGRGWALSVALIQLAYYRHTNPPLVASARHVIAQVLGQERG